jgi:hypothetical protein
MKKHMLILPVFLVAVIALILGAAVPDGRAATIQLDDSDIYAEINWTDGDAGIHIFLDGEGWDMMEVFDPDGNSNVAVMAENSVGEQGITELFFESAEPSFEEQSLAEFLELFLAGNYKFEGETTEGDTLKGTGKFTHNFPCAPNITLATENPDGSLTIEWELVTQKLNTAADPVVCGGGPINIAGYDVVVEFEQNGTEQTYVVSTELGPLANSLTVAPDFLDSLAGMQGELKFEVIAREVSGNQTITEGEFESAEE